MWQIEKVLFRKHLLGSMITLDPKHHPQEMAEKTIADKTIAEWEEALNPDLTNELLSDSELRDLGDFL